MQPNPYAADLGTLEPINALGETPQQIRKLVEGWTDEQFERTYAPGKWSARKILVHLAQTEFALGTRARYALTEPGYAAQAFSQDDWMPLDERTDARSALDAYTSLRRLAMFMWRSLTRDQWERTFTHPEYGELNVRWIAAQMAGHDIHHLRQFELIGGTG